MNPKLSSIQDYLPLMKYLFGANNDFMGKIPSFICGLCSLYILDLSNNKFNGTIPRCLGNFNMTLGVLNVRKNRLSGGIPENLSQYLVSLDIGHNQLEGKLPRSLVRISSLEVLNVESNKFSDTFPLWLSSLQELQVLVLRSNSFHGPIQKIGFYKLRIIDISSNHFSGTLPSDFFVNWTARCSFIKVANNERKCFVCNKPEHLAKNCKLRKIESADLSIKETEDDSEDEGHMLFSVVEEETSSRVDDETWLVDSGCTNHMTKEVLYFITLDQSIKIPIKVGNGLRVMTAGKGNIQVMTSQIEKIIKEVFLVPDLARNLLNVSQMVSNGCGVLFKSNRCFIDNPQGRKILNIKMKDKSFPFRWSNSKINVVLAHEEKSNKWREAMKEEIQIMRQAWS